MNMRVIAILIAYLGAACAFASSDVPLPTRSIEFASSMDDKVILEMGYKQAHTYDFSTNHLTGLTLVWDGEHIVVPPKNLAEITMIQLDTVRVQRGSVHSGPAYRYVQFLFGDPVGSQPGDFVTVSFFFIAQQYARMEVEVPYDNTYARRADSRYFTRGGFRESTNAVAETIGELVEKMKADMRFHRELIKRREANQKVDPVK